MKGHTLRHLLSVSVIMAFLLSMGAVACMPTPEVIVVTATPVPEEGPPEGRPPEEGPPGEVQITFTADRTNLQPGECAMLEWSVQGGFGVFLNEQPVDWSGRTQVCPEETTPYVLGVDTGETVEVREVVISVASAGEPPPPEEPLPGEVQIAFTADRTTVQPGECAILEWSVEGGFGVELSGQPVDWSGQRQVCPGETTPYVLGVDTGETVEVREVVIVVAGAGQPPPTQPATAQPQPTQPGCPGPPMISSFTANPSTITAGQSSTLNWGPVTNGNTSQLVRSVVINPGLGEVGSPGSRVVSPTTTTTYTMTATGCGGTKTQQVTVTVTGAPPPPPPAATATPTPWTTDLAVTDLYPDKWKNGTVYGRITNHGPGTCKNVQIQFSCSWAKTAYGATFGLNQAIGPKKITITSLNPGQTADFNTGITVDITQFWYDMTCSIQVPFNDPNTANNSYQEKLSK
ncbi:MAG: hypothetical protein ACE5NP_01405 [Anaerolineae bacterium]